MRLLVVAPFVPYPPDSGGAIRVYHLLRCLARRHEVTLLCLDDGTGDAGNLPFCRAVHTVPAPRFPRPWHEHLAALPVAVPGSIAIRSEPLREALRELLRTGTYDLVQVEFLGLAHLIEELDSQPAVLVEHTVGTDLRRRQLRIAPRNLRWLYHALDYAKLLRYEPAVLSRYSGAVAMSSRDALRISRWAPALPVGVVPNGVDTTAFAPDGESDPNEILFIGSFHLDPANVDGVLHFVREIFPRIRSRWAGAALTIVGHSPPPEVSGLSACPGITVRGYVSDVRPYFARASVIVLPLRAGSGTKIRFLTAMAMGRPVVATTLGAEGMDATPGEEFVLADDPERFAEETVQLMRDPERRRAIGTAAREKAVRDYDWGVIGEKLEEFLSDVRDLRIRRHHN